MVAPLRYYKTKHGSNTYFLNDKDANVVEDHV